MPFIASNTSQTMLHQGTRGYLHTAAAQHRLREAYFRGNRYPVVTALAPGHNPLHLN